LAVVVAACAPPPGLAGFETAEIEVGEESLTVAMAETSSQRSQGLRNADELPDGLDGMLFVFEEARTATFGMRDTSIPLDIWWFDAEGRLIASTEMEPCPTSSCPTYRSPGEVAWALETPRGDWEFVSGETLDVEVED
jgi:uncharacterized membrane protein (UPF0127 family)